MPHDFADLALGILVSACGWLITRLVSRIDALEERQEKNATEIHNCRAAIGRIEGSLELTPFPYSEG